MRREYALNHISTLLSYWTFLDFLFETPITQVEVHQDFVQKDVQVQEFRVCPIFRQTDLE